ncbi:hypothetical protein NDU88_006932 [Pleurodeles waltl]|uniref:Myb/SANT-like DNA-binding domain-containing protein n=1 Tax=Pleurodeles waltl TaxID=8319 RepID=A0AAV7MIQ1_PLEWA|nr:hypothetical protein NDU88_006932 [Pleurodeles waltl]
MAPQRHPRFSEEELRVMVEEIIRVEPQLFGAQLQQISIARKMELWRRIVNRVNAVGQHPRTRDDIRKRWTNLQGKVRSIAARHQLAVQRTSGGPPPPPPQLTTWEEQVLAIMHPEGLAEVAGGLDSGEDLHCMCCCDLCLEPTMARVTGERAPAFTSAELERLVDGVLPQYGLLYGPPDQQVSTHQKKGIWRAIAKDVRTLGVYGRRSTHCRKWWEDLRCWARIMAEAQLGMASQ